ncbi:uncharacterized protein LOC108219127 [Daucus carota subsp. sativus]|uniref:uncharacterized protein LOC108219127 n=1 Tax=Daucus carota subsp. sativus TaxID=79200 RepID=UPI0007EFF54F|nr:PREDICTED: uncharacterized protein LOC108219127 [Daucus carota subsp. sativus]
MSNGDLDQRNASIDIEESTAMTIEFLRARLLSERSVSRSARQRADELARRVLELEEQLKIVSLERMKAEKATADVLAILETGGASDLSEEYNSSSDQEATPSGSEVGRSSLTGEENLADQRSCGRSLSWKSEKDSPCFLEKKYKNSSRRRHGSVISSANSSPKQVGKSCRRIKRRETTETSVVRSAADQLQIDTNRLPLEGCEVAESPNVPTIADNVPATSEEPSEVLENHRLSNGHSLSAHGEDKDMEIALEQQAQLIQQYEAEEKAQRDWEEKFRETNSRIPVSFDVGNHSDVTEDRDESREPASPFGEDTFVSCNQEPSLADERLSVSYEPTRVKKSTSNVAFKSQASDVALSKGGYDQQQSVAHHYFPPVSQYNGVPQMENTEVFSSTTNGLNKEASGSTNQFSLMPHDTSNKLGSVLEALQQAKASLKQNLNRSPILDSGPVRPLNPSVRITGSENGFEFPVGSAGLFRLPTDFQHETTAPGHFRRSGSQLSSTNNSPGPVGDRFYPSPYMQSRSNSPGDGLFTTRANPYMDPRSTLPTMFPVFRTMLDSERNTALAYSSPDPRLNAGLPSGSRYSSLDYPPYPEMVRRMPAETALSGPAANRDMGVRYPSHSQHYDDPRQYMYR